MLKKISIYIALFAAAFNLAAQDAASKRRTISLDGQWEIAEGSFAIVPEKFPSKIPVPGYADMAVPAFGNVGVRIPLRDRTLIRKICDPLREAFWYRRTVSVEGAIPDVAQIKIYKACYTSTLYVNGVKVGKHYASFTPKTFDVKKFLKEGENEIMICVGAGLSAVPAQYATGIDFEKTLYLPGIYDSVELTLSGGNFVEEAQIVPDLERGGIRVVGQIANFDGRYAISSTKEYQPKEGTALKQDGSGTKVGMKFIVRERVSGKTVAESEIESPAVCWFGRETFDAFVKIPGFKAWSPETPFLYTLEIETPSDKWTSRFGMRTFKGNSKTGVFELNGRPYYMRGTNITYLRFTEDPLRKNLPWNEEWVRDLHKSFKLAHWNSIRYCIGFPPEKWYEIADEEGFLIQDEFPIWTGPRTAQCDITSDVLSLEYMQWMKQRINYPCVVIWDAQNESIDIPAVNEASSIVRDYDLSRRPWDFGWGIQMRAGDSSERHPYRTSRLTKPKSKYKFPQELEKDSTYPLAAHYRGGIGTSDFKPIIVNEYCWLWLNRDGTPTTLTTNVYKTLCGEDASKETIRLTGSRYVALLTEFWRTGRDCAAVLHFCGLGYSRPDGQTSDNFIDVEKLEYQPVFKEYVFDSFTPVGVCIKYFETDVEAGAKIKIPVIYINDEYENFDGSAKLEIFDADGKKLFEASMPVKLKALGKVEASFDVSLPKNAGKYDMHVRLYKGAERQKYYTRSVRWLNVKASSN